MLESSINNFKKTIVKNITSTCDSKSKETLLKNQEFNISEFISNNF